jgi:hypothetical protein
MQDTAELSAELSSTCGMGIMTKGAIWFGGLKALRWARELFSRAEGQHKQPVVPSEPAPDFFRLKTHSRATLV